MTASLASRVFLLLLASASAEAASIERALNRMYNFDFNSADREMDGYISAQPGDALGYSFRAASLLFRELDRLSVLESDFFANNKRLTDEKQLKPNEELKQRFLDALQQSNSMARSRLAVDGNDKNAVFAQCLSAGLLTNYMGLIEKRQLGSLSHAKESHSYAVRLLKLDPTFVDAHFTTGMTEYLLGSVPFFVKWFVRFEEAEGNKALAIERLKIVVERGKYLGPFAKILLATIDLREKRPLQAEMRLSELSRDFPENPLFKKELNKLRPKIK